MSANITSEIFFHFTTRVEHLKSILKYGFFPRYCAEYTLDVADIRAASIGQSPQHAMPMVCFCDLPVGLIGEHYGKYGPYGIGLDREWGLEKGLAPVTYMHETAQTLKPSQRVTANTSNGGNPRLKNDVRLLAAFTKLYKGFAWRNGQSEGPIMFYHEREWRHVPPTALLKRDDYQNEAKLKKLHKQLQKRPLTFHPKYIQYLILPAEDNEDNIIDLHNYVMGLYTKKYSRAEAIPVTTTIMTHDRMLGDV